MLRACRAPVGSSNGTLACCLFRQFEVGGLGADPSSKSRTGNLAIVGDFPIDLVFLFFVFFFLRIIGLTSLNPVCRNGVNADVDVATLFWLTGR